MTTPSTKNDQWLAAQRGDQRFELYGWLVVGLLAAALFFFGCGTPMGPDGGTPMPTDDAAVQCQAGTEGCECAAGGRCGRNARGETLLCQGGVCAAMTCPAGDPGCVCSNGSSCNGGASCTNGFCVAANCLPGQRNCACLAGGCDPGNVCLEGAVCVDNTGSEGGACLATGRCLRGNRCDTTTGRCVFCTPGSAGCACTTSDGCNAGLACTAGLCLSAAELPPANPRCFTGCGGDITQADGGVRVCTADRVIEGCLEGRSCVQGSCVAPGENPPTCAEDLDCPPFQVCLTGGCYSNCDSNSDCGSGFGCYRHACRPSCVVSGTTPCPSGAACTSDDGQNGFCTPVGTTTGTAQVLPTTGLRVLDAPLALSNIKPSASFVIVPEGTSAQDVTIRKLWHSSTNPAGVTERVDAKQVDGGYLPCDPLRNECPMQWVSLTVPGGTATQDPTASFRLLPGCVEPGSDGGTPCPRITVNGGNTTAVKWEGELEITTRDATARVYLSYAQRPDGQWSGAMYYFGTFSNTGLPAWIGSSTKSTSITTVNNALMQRWGALRNGLPGGWNEFLAVLTSTREGSWNYASVKQRCPGAGAGPNAVCYPFDGAPLGVTPYVQNPTQYPVPTGVTELPVAMNLQLSGANGDLFTGRLVSSAAMHYPGNPAVKLQFSGDPSKLASCTTAGPDCLVLLKDVNSMMPVPADINRLTSNVGGRYVSSDGTCVSGYSRFEVPWLIPGLTDGTVPATGGGRSRVECRDTELPFDGTLSTNVPINVGLAGANPVPDGQARTRTLRFFDGALVNQSTLFVLFEESYPSTVPGRLPTTAYGYMLLNRIPVALAPSDFVGLSGATTVVKNPPSTATLSCDPQLMSDLGVSMTDKVDVATKMLDGNAATYTAVSNPATAIHYFCQDTGLFNGGPGDVGASSVKVPCPDGSKVTFFNVCDSTGTCGLTPGDLANDQCQLQRQPEPGGATCSANSDCRSGMCSAGVCVIGTCGDRLRALKSTPGKIFEGGTDDQPLMSRCTSAGVIYCDDDRRDLRTGKTFYRRLPATPPRAFLELQRVIDDAFRYRVRFRSSTSGSAVGFAPQQCAPNSDAIPYCYDVRQLQEARQRVDCLAALYDDSTWFNALSTPTELQLKNRLIGFLKQDFAQLTQGRDGFERLYAELLTMLGDEALTAAYASRFDLAAAGGANFRGSAFEPGGIDLSGVAGAEMYNLHQAVQYYQLALDRLYAFGPTFQVALSRGNVGVDPDVITSGMVTSYLERLVRTASQKARAWGEIARRYQNFNRPDLARKVIERAYVGTYLESALISRLMLDITEQSAAASLPQLRITIEKAQRNYRMSLLDMRDTYAKITDETNFFGYAPDYVPFPALDGSSVSSANAYEVVSLLAKQRLDLAKTREQAALTFGKQGKVDAAQFQSELTTIRNTYENQLSSLCGTFVKDGTVYPATRKYADLLPTGALTGDPCGTVDNGDLRAAKANVQDQLQALQQTVNAQGLLQLRLQNEQRSVARQCKLIDDLADYQFDVAGQVRDLNTVMAVIRGETAIAVGTAQVGVQALTAKETAAGVAIVGALGVLAQAVGDAALIPLQRDVEDYQAASARRATQTQCDLAQVQSDATVSNLIGELLASRVNVKRAEYQVQLAVAEVRKLTNTAQRLQAQQEEAESLAIDVQAAQNDPNVRIYQNDAIINADVSFNAALAAAYRLTRVFEYYTSQTYARKDQLFLIRMVTAGQYNLENYLLELDNEFQNFEEQFGNPDVRVLALSLRDDIFQIPYSDERGHALSEEQRVELLRARLKDPKLLDRNGYLTIPFTTRLADVSPVTRNHKIRHVEIDLQGVDLGDAVARVYLRMSGTGVVRNVNDQTDFFVFPQRLGVVNTSRLGAKAFDPEVYRNYRFRDRPLVNTLWELIINQRDEAANKDIDLHTLNDLRVLFYYSDFTSL
ncbi:MAG: hypothetical protein U0228_11525 [Myxococcaceae bacterium]